MSTVTIVISVVTVVINRVIIIASHGLRAGAAQRQFGTAGVRFRSPSPVLGASPEQFHTATTVTGRDFRLSSGDKTFLDRLWTFSFLFFLEGEGTFGKSLGRDLAVGGVLRFFFFFFSP